MTSVDITKEMTAQEIFDTVVRHLATMKKQSLDRRGECCVYRDDDGCKCAVGCLLTDEECNINPSENERLERRSMLRQTLKEKPVYTLDDLDNNAVAHVNDKGFLPLRLKQHIALLDKLQKAHDEPANWPKEEDEGCRNGLMGYALAMIAIDRDLDRAVLKECGFPVLVIEDDNGDPVRPFMRE